jgi:hypothetical protein
MNIEGKIESGNRIDRILRRKQAAEILGVSTRTLIRMGLPHIKISERVTGYCESAIADHIASRENRVMTQAIST